MGDGAVVGGRPLCPCHGEPMDTWRGTDGHTRTRCRVKRRAAQLAAYHADPSPRNYERGRYLRLQRLRAKEARLAELEANLASEE